MTHTIYQLELNGKRYIGQTTRLKQREYSHRSELKCNRHKSKAMQVEFNKAPGIYPTLKIIDVVATQALADEAEEFSVEFFKPEYNTCRGGKHNGLDAARTPKALAKKAEKMRAPELRQKSREQLHKTIMSAPDDILLGWKSKALNALLSKESQDKSLATRRTPEARAMVATWTSKAVVDDRGITYPSATAASKALKVPISTVSKAIKVERKVKGRTFRYV